MVSERTFAGVVVKSVGVRKSAADLEDIEFLTCQEELQEQLLRKHLEVERVIGKKSHFNYFYCLILNDGARPYLVSLSPRSLSSRRRRQRSTDFGLPYQVAGATVFRLYVGGCRLDWAFSSEGNRRFSQSGTIGDDAEQERSRKSNDVRGKKLTTTILLFISGFAYATEVPLSERTARVYWIEQH